MSALTYVDEALRALLQDCYSFGSVTGTLFVGELAGVHSSGGWCRASIDGAEAVGICVSRADGGARVQLVGKVDLPTASLTPGRLYWLGLNGALSLTPPSPGEAAQLAQPVGLALSPARLVLRLSRPTSV